MNHLSSLNAFISQFLAHRHWVVITGAGISTDSGIPDYRDENGQWKRPQPIYFQPFMHEPAVRARYWARSMVGWRFFGNVQPNEAHRQLTRLQQKEWVTWIVTQNVDDLHTRAGSNHVLPLHGSLSTVRCMQCQHLQSRDAYQTQLEAANQTWQTFDASIAPDGDADLLDVDFSQFNVPACPICGGICKPDVVFYGENVPPERHEQATKALRAADGLLVLGSSLMVQSSYRYAQLAHSLGKPLLIANLGVTRADHLATARIALPIVTVLGELEAQTNAIADSEIKPI